MSWRPESAPRLWTHPLRRLAATSLRSASKALARLAQHVAAPEATPLPRIPEVLEFYAEAGAPEGALYLDGQLVGYIPSVRRL
ncbi:MAG: hypothetical protein KF891_22310 [Rhizobacter sp.]|nr:hypothetical protein [Rhizobacter sp.]